MDLKIKCEIHNLPALCFDDSKDSKKKLLCLKCITTRFHIRSIEEFNAYQLSKLNQINQLSEQSLKLLKNLIEAVTLFKHEILQSIEKLLQIILEKIKNIEEKKSYCKQLFDSINENTIDTIRENQENLIDIIFGIKDQLHNDLITLSNISKTDSLFKIFQNFDPKMDFEDQVKKKVKLEQLDKSYSDNVSTQSSLFIDKKFDYQLIQQSSYKENEFCGAISFNKGSTLAITGSGKLIKVFEFKEDKLKEIQQLNGHTESVYCLKFMKKYNQFISGSDDGTIIIWEQQQNNQWKSIQVLKEHTNSIETITINKNDDIIISGSTDNTIKFWQRENNTWSSKQSIECSSEVYSVSLSHNEDALIASIYDKQILVIELQHKQWIIKQKISVEQYGLRLCFINQNQFVFQPFDSQYLQIYDYDEKEQKYKQEEQVKYQNKGQDDYCLFPICYIQQMGLILVKNDQYVHLIKRTQNGQYTVEQSIHFGTYDLYGCISDDGRYIATWDYKSNEIQIRKLNE